MFPVNFRRFPSTNEDVSTIYLKSFKISLLLIPCTSNVASFYSDDAKNSFLGSLKTKGQWKKPCKTIQINLREGERWSDIFIAHSVRFEISRLFVQNLHCRKYILLSSYWYWLKIGFNDLFSMCCLWVQIK